MSTGNGRIPLIGHRSAMKKDSDLITLGEARSLVVEESAKVHEHYLTQIPKYVAGMIQEALVHHKLVTVEELLAETASIGGSAPTDTSDAPPAAGAVDAPLTSGEADHPVNPS